GMILGGLSDPAPEVREAAMKSVRDDLAFQGENPAEPILAQVMTLLKGSDAEARLAVLTAVKRNPVILHETRVAEFAKGILENPKERALALTVIDTDLADDARATKVIAEAWNETEKDDARLALIERLFARKAMVDAAEPSKELIGLLRTIALDPATAIREKLIENLEKTEKLRRSPRMATVLHSALSDSSPGIRLRSLKLAQDQTAFWREGDTAEYMLRLLIDPGSKIRALALDTVGKFDLLGAEPRFARRVMALAADKSLGEKAKSLLVSKGFDPAKLEADGAVQGFGIPDLEFFKEKVNPYFYKEGADGHSCYDCHQNHNILRIASIPLGSDKLPEDLVIQNLNSALKVVNLGDPEQSLILRKPRSPQGQGEAPPDSPTGLVHVGGPRWASTTDPAYQEFLSWIRDAAQGNKLRLGVGVTVDSYSPDYPPALALDGDPQTIWHTEFVGATPPYPHEIVIDLGAPSATSAFQYVPRQDGSNGRVKEWELYASADGKEWGEKLASGEWPDDAAVKTVPLRAKGIRYVKLRGLSSVNNLPLMSAAEVIVLKAKDQIARGE
ncbi:discoidin domain-containing protein, partial [Candidatus Sumerlaeota bacterium]|nr:discoidin domain-containing protein [Candidatus Sumerlaeota bacterium]